MKKPVDHQDPDMADEYDFSKGKRGVYYEWYQSGKSRISLVTDEEDRRRQELERAKRRPTGR
jgi:hypothetical protein